MKVKNTVTPKKLAANRRNAQRSTGPKTLQGKHVAALNAVKSGVFARHALITVGPGKEDNSDLDRLLAGLYKHFQPEGLFESLLVETVAACVWRRRRLLRFEAGRIRNQIDDALHHERVRLLFSDETDMDSEQQSPAPADVVAPAASAKPANVPPAPGQAPPAATRSPAHPTGGPDQTQVLPPGGEGWNLEAHILPAGPGADIILRYAAALDRELDRTLNQLERVQRQRRGELLPPPVNVNLAAAL